MGYTTSKGHYVGELDLNLAPLLGLTISAAGTTYSAVYEMESRRNVTAKLIITSISTDDTLDVTIESSDDGTNYWTVCTFTQGTDATSDSTERKSCTAVGRYLRAKFVTVAVADPTLVLGGVTAKAV
jgi:hypothetical protein